jgi:hypothetical protein
MGVEGRNASKAAGVGLRILYVRKREIQGWRARDTGQRRNEGKRKRPLGSLDDLCGSDAISEASLESGSLSLSLPLSEHRTPVLVNHCPRDPPTLAQQPPPPYSFTRARETRKIELDR